MSTLFKLGAFCVALAMAGAVSAEDKSLEGKWLLSVLSTGERGLALIKVTAKDGALSAEPLIPMGATATAEQKGESVSLILMVGGSEYPFTGKWGADGDDAEHVLGTFVMNNIPQPARLEKTDEDTLPRPSANSALAKYAAAMREQDIGDKVQKLQTLIEEEKSPMSHLFYGALLKEASQAELSADQVADHINNWLESTEKYGAAWTAQCRLSAITALAGQKPYADLALDLAQQADKELGDDTPLERQALVVKALATAARDAGNADLAARAADRSDKIETALDEEYHRKVPPFEPETYTGRKEPDHNRVVLMELFTGAQCPPCVAADVAFDALIKTYKPTEVVTLQYHLHIPGPDPLTNPDSIERSQYYAARGTPSTYFNGSSEAGGGGGMANAKNKYEQYRQVIDARLEDKRSAEITLRLTRSGNKILVNGTAQAELPPVKAAEKKEADEPAKRANDEESGDKDADKKAKGKQSDAENEDSDKADEPKLRLRLALTEESIRYVGGNKLRFHHHVVRGLPGGTEGIELVAGQCQVDQTIDLDEVRTTLNRYVEEYESGSRKFPATPEIELKGLSLVAFVQNDADKSVWHAITLPIPASK